MILASRPRFRASGRPQGPRLSGVPAGISHNGFPEFWDSPNFGIPGFWEFWDSPNFGIPGFWDSWVLRAAPRATVQGVPGKGFRRKHSSVPVSDVPTRLGIPAGLFRASLRVGRQAGKPAPGQSPPRLAPRTIYGNMLHLSDWHRKVRPQSSWRPSTGRTTRKTFSRDWKKSIEEISPREWEKFQERHPETISIGKRERGAEPG